MKEGFIMSELLFAANTVLPLLLLMSAGFISRKIGLLNDGLVKGINQLIFKLFLPVNLFMSVLKTPYDTQISGKEFLFVFFGLTALLTVMAPPRVNRTRGVATLAMSDRVVLRKPGSCSFSIQQP